MLGVSVFKGGCRPLSFSKQVIGGDISMHLCIVCLFKGRVLSREWKTTGNRMEHEKKTVGLLGCRGLRVRLLEISME